MQAADLEVIKEIPGYKLVLKAVLKHQIQQLVEQLSDHTGEESVILTASVSDGSLSHLGTESGKIFLEDNDDIKSKFLGFCLKRYHGQNRVENQQSDPSPTNKTITHSRQRPTPARRYSAPNQQASPPVQTGVHPVSLTKVSQRGRKRHKPYANSQTRRTSVNVNRQEQTSEQQAFPVALPVQPGNNLTNDINTLETIKIEIDDEVEILNSDSIADDLKVPCVLESKSSVLAENKAHEDSTTENELNESIAHDRNDLDSRSFNVPIRATEENVTVNKSVSSDKSISDLDPNVHIKTESLDSEINFETIGVQSGQISEDIWMPNLQTLESTEPASSSQRDMTADQNKGLWRKDQTIMNKNFACNLCERSFMSKTDVIRHVRIHTGEKPFHCDICGKAFRIKHQLVNHKLVHTKNEVIQGVLRSRRDR